MPWHKSSYSGDDGDAMSNVLAPEKNEEGRKKDRVQNKERTGELEGRNE